MHKRPLIVIPARMASTRFPNKPLAKIAGLPMIERVWKIAKTVSTPCDVVIATDDATLKSFAESFGAAVIMTSPSCETGTDRVAEVARHLKAEYDVFFSFQGDAVLTPPWVIDDTFQAVLNHPDVVMATPAVKLVGEARTAFIASKREGSSSGTSVVFNHKGDAIYFSKTLIPYQRDGASSQVPIYRHIGLYAYRGDVLQRLSKLPQGPLEQAEKLEQLRALENGIPIRVVPVDYQGRTHGSVDRPEDVAIVESIIAQEGELISIIGQKGN